MNIIKKKAFNERMSLKKVYPNHQHLYAKGGIVRQNFDDGGTVNTLPVATTLGGPSASYSGGATNPNVGIGGTIGGLLGTNDTYQAGAPVTQAGTNNAQLNQAYSGVQGALTGQQALASTLTPQAQSAAANQAALAQQFSTEAAGGGPNVAGAQLNQATAQNVANQAALQAGQRGAGANVGLIARQAAQQGAATQQQAAQGAATLEQQQEITAQQNQANLANNQISQTGQAVTNATNAQMGEQGTLQGANTAYNNTQAGVQGNINNVNAQTAAANQKSNTGLVGGAIGGISAGVQSILGGLNKGGEVKAAAGGVMSAPPNLGTISGAQSNSSSGGPNIPGTADFSSGPSENLQADATNAVNGIIDAYQPSDSSNSAWQSQLNNDTAEYYGAPGSNTYDMSNTMEARGGRICTGPHNSHVANYLAGGNVKEVDALVSPKEVYLNPKQVKEVVERGADPMKIGHHFPGKDKVKGKDSLKNDVIPKKLEDGGVVIPIHITTHKDASAKGRKFVEHAMAKHMKRPKGK